MRNDRYELAPTPYLPAFRKCVTLGFILIATFSLSVLQAQDEPLPAPAGPDPVARVNGHEITREQFDSYFFAARREEYYHRNPPAEELEKFRIKTMQQMINHLLLQDEAGRRGIGPDEQAVQARLEQLESRFASSPNWEEQKDETLTSVRSQLEDGSRVEILEAQTRDVGEPTEDQLLAYYDSNPESFTEPGQRRVSLILIKVDPSSTQEVREAAQAEAQGLVDRLNQGEDFAMLAEAFSMDPSAENGGDMGWMHEGLLNQQAETALAELEVGAVSAPVRVLEGYAILRLDEIRNAQKHSLENVHERATSLWQRDAGEKTWEDLIESLRSAAQIEIFDSSLAKPVENAGVST